MRKVLSFVLVLSLVLGSFSMAFAATEAQASLSDIAGNANEEAITVNFNLGIIEGMPDGTFAPDQAVTRAQFAAMMTRALAVPDSALAGYTATTFKDTAGYGWAVPYLAFCQSKGILVGDGAGNVMPGRTVSVNEAMTMVLRAIGYTNNSAALVGVWPANYVSLAQNNGLYDDVATAVGVTRANAAQIIYNALTVDKVEVASDGTTKVLTGKSMLTTGLNCTETKNYVIVGNEDTLISLKAYIGKMVTVYKNKDKDIIAIAGVDSDTISGKFNAPLDIVATTAGFTVSGTSIKFTDDSDDEVEYTVKAGTVAYYFENGESKEATMQIPSTASVTINGDIVGKEIRSIDSINAWTVNGKAKINQAQINSIKDDSLLGGSFVTLKNGDIDTTSFELAGVTSLDKIAVDNVVYAYWNSKNEITKVQVGTEVVVGEVTTVKSNGKFVVNGKTYEKSDNAASSYKTPSAGDEIKAYLDYDGKVFSITVTSGTVDNYGVVVAKDATYDKVRLYTAADEKTWFEYDDDYTTTVGGIATNATGLIGYSLDSKGKIDKIETEVVSASAATLSGLTLRVTGGSSSAPSYRVADDAVVFGTTGGAVTVATKIGKVDTLTNLNTVIFMLDDGVIEAIVMSEAYTSATSEDTYAVIDTINSVKNKDGDTVQQLIGFSAGAAFDKLTTGKNTAAALGSAPTLYKVEFDADGAVKSATNSLTAAKGYDNDIATVLDVDGNKLQLTGAAIASPGEWVTIAKDAVVYRAVLDDGDLDSYKVSDIAGINADYKVYLYNTVDDDDSAGADGYDVVIYVTKGDL